MEAEPTRARARPVPRLGADRRRRPRCSAACRADGSRGASSARRSSSTARRRSARAPGRCAPRSGRRTSRSGRRRSPNVAVLRLLREEGIGADVASAGRARVRARSRLPRRRDRRPRQQQGRGACCARRPPRARPSSSTRPTRRRSQPRPASQRVLVRVTLGVDADTHEAIRTGHHGSKFGLPPDQAPRAVEDALARGLDVLGLHVHVGSQLADFDAQAETIVRLASFAASLSRRARLDRRGSPTSVAASGSAHHPDEHAARRGRAGRERRRDGAHSPSPRRGSRRPRSGSSRAARSSAAQASTLYRVGAVKRLPERTWVAIDGGMSDNPRPQLYDARLHGDLGRRARRAGATSR